MAASVRQAIMVGVTSALTGITVARGYQSSVLTVSENIRTYSEMGDGEMPACFPIDTNERKEALTFRQTTTGDMKATLTVLVTSYLFARGGVSSGTRSDLLRDIEKAIVNATAMTSVVGVLDIRPTKVVTDQGTVENYSIHDSEFEIDYTYNHADGG